MLIKQSFRLAEVLFNKFYSLKNLVLLYLFLLLWQCTYYALFPNPGADGPIYLSHTFSVIQGYPFKNFFLEEYIRTFNFPYLYGFFNAPFYFLFKDSNFQVYSIFLWNIVWIILFLYGCYLTLKRGTSFLGKFTIISIAYLVSVYTNTLRSETFILPFFILLQFLLCKTFQFHQKVSEFLYAPLLLSIIGLMHPVAGVYGCVFAFLFAIDKKIPISKLIYFFLLCVVYTVILYLPVVMVDFDSWKLNFFQRGFIERTHTLTDIFVFLKYVSLNPSIIILVAVCILNTESIYKEIAYWIVIYFTIAFFHQSYYFQYLFSFALWRFSVLNSFKVPLVLKTGFLAVVLYSISVTYFLRMFQIAENYQYAKTFRQILYYLKDSGNENPDRKVWVSGELAMPIINKPNAKLHWPFIVNYKMTMQPIDSSSVFYLDNIHQLDYIKQYYFIKNAYLEINEIIKPVKGLVTVSWNGKRSDSLGLWEVKVLIGAQTN
jgi:hypothetical protein